MLNDANAIDVEFLGMDSLDPIIYRDTASNDEEVEDTFCRALLLLGAKWYDSTARYFLISRVIDGDQSALNDLEEGRIPDLTRRERRWVCVGWIGESSSNSTDERSETAGTGEGRGFYVLDYDTNLPGILDDEVVPMDVGRLLLCRTMAERCTVLRSLGARFYENLRAYDGDAETYLRAWDWKKEGE